MPPKTKFTREDVIDGAFEIVKEQGFSKLTARSVAKRLGSTVAPIYVNFETIEDLSKAVVERVHAMSYELVERQKGSLYEKIGRASIAFAGEYPVLFRELAMQPNSHRASYDEMEKSLVEAMALDENFSGWALEERRSLLFKMRAFQMGLAAMVANEQVPSWLTRHDVEELLMEVGGDLLRIEQIKMKERRK